MTTISVKENAELPFYEFNNFIDAANQLLEMSGYILIRESELDELPKDTQEDYFEHKKNNSKNYLDI